MNILTYKGYRGSFEYDPDADIFHGDILDITDVVTFQGRSIDELKKALADSIEDYLEFCEEQNKLPDQPYSGHILLTISPEIYQKIILTAKRSGMNINSWVTKTLMESMTQ